MRQERFKVISVDDEAIDTESMPFDVMADYSKTRDIKLLMPYIRPGMQPVVFHVKAVPHAMWESFVMSGGQHEDVRFRRAFICGVELVENIPSEDGRLLTLKPEHNVPGVGATWTEDEINKRFAPSEVLEIGSVVFHHSFLPRRKSLIWELPSLCAAQLVNRKFRSVDANQSTAETKTSSQPSDATAATTETAKD